MAEAKIQLRKRHTRRKRQIARGFTLLEVLIATVLLTTGVIIVAGLFSAGLSSSDDAEMTGIAMNLAQKRIEEIQNLNYTSGVANESRAAVAGFSGFQRAVAVTTPATDLKQVTVTVFWSDKGNDVNTSLTTYISNN
jgi:Tfp pilus assembly protein PilV